MVGRFFSILLRNWTYEMEYRTEIVRMLFINIITIGFPIVMNRVPSIPNWFLLILNITMYSSWVLNIRFSIGRMLQIGSNKKYALLITKKQLLEIGEAYPNEPFYAKINGKYFKIKSSKTVDESDSIVLITIGRKPVYELKKIRAFLK